MLLKGTQELTEVNNLGNSILGIKNYLNNLYQVKIILNKKINKGKK